MDDSQAPASMFDDGKDPQALRTIGEVGKAFGLRPHVLRYWEEQIPTLQPIKRSGNRRYYRAEDIALIAEIDRLVHREGYTLKGAARTIEGAPAQAEMAGIPERSMPENVERLDDDFRQKLAVIREDLATALAAA